MMRELRERTVPAVLARGAAQWPDKPAIEADGDVFGARLCLDISGS